MTHRRSLSLATSITLVVLAASFVALAVFAGASVALSRGNSIAQLDARLSTLADIIGQNSTAALDFNDRQSATEVLQALKSEPRIVSACLYDSSGLLFAEYRRDSSSAQCPRQLDRRSQVASNFRDVVRPVIRHTEVVGAIRLTSDIRQLLADERRVLAISLLLAFASVGIAGFSGSLLQRRISRPIVRLVRAMHRVTSEEGFDAEVKVSGGREMADLAVEFNTMLSELKRRDRLARLADARLHEQARTDALTGLPNRRLFTECLSTALAAAERRERILGLLYIDLDGFKLVNDSLGHRLGDLLLCEVAARLRSRIRRSDTLARIGGDEFTVILTTLKSSVDAGIIAESLLESMARPFRVEGHEITVGASIGISTLGQSHLDGADLLRQADSAMYAAKRAGKNRSAYFTDDLSHMARERLTLENQLRGAIERDEIHVHYQPEFNAMSGELVRFEALARWIHPAAGEVSPLKFIPIAEESGFIHALGSYVLEQACREAVLWQAFSTRPIQVAVNVSPIQFNSDNLVPVISDILARTGLRPQLLQLELTESVMVGSLERSAEKMRNLTSLGVSLALDDFGTGYSCLSYLPDLPLTAIKLDRSFILKMSPKLESNMMIRSLVDLAHSMNMSVIAEGVEERSQLELVTGLGVDEVQGFLLGCPSGNPSEQLAKSAEIYSIGFACS